MKKIVVLFLVIYSIVSCTQEEIGTREYPRVRTRPVESVSDKGVTFVGEILSSNAPILQHGFVWSTSESIDLVRSERLNLGALGNPGQFRGSVSFGLETGKKYYVKSFVSTEDYTVYGEVIAFVSLGSLAPVIESFSPTEATWGDTITISGNNLAGDIYFSDHLSTIVERTDKAYRAIVPVELTERESNVRVVFSGASYSSNKKFLIKPPAITEFTPSEGGAGSIVTIKGKYFHPTALSVMFNDKSSEIISKSPNEIKCKVPVNLKYGENFIKVVSASQLVTSTKPFFAQSPVVEELIPTEGFYGDTIVINGKNFGDKVGDNMVMFEDEKAEIISFSSSEIRVIVPDRISISQPIVSLSYNQQTTSAGKFNILPPIIENILPIKIAPNSLITINGKGFSLDSNVTTVKFNGELGYIYSISRNQIQVKAQPKIYTNEIQVELSSSGNIILLDQKLISPWKIVSNIPTSSDGLSLSVSTIFSIADKIYLVSNSYGFSGPRFFLFELESTNTWRLKTELPIDILWVFALDGKFIFGNYLNDVYELNLSSNIVLKKNNAPFSFLPTYTNIKFGISASGIGYVVHSNNELWKYNDMEDTWEDIKNFPSINPLKVFAIGNEIFMIGQSTFDSNATLSSYNTANGQWNSIQFNPMVRVDEINSVFVANEVAYYGKLIPGLLFEFNRNNELWNQNNVFPSSNGFSSIYNYLSKKGYMVIDDNLWEFDPIY